MSSQPLPHPDREQPPDDDPETIATPEGDNEYLPDQPLTPDASTPVRPRGDQPHTVVPLYPVSC
jgi:hypothetical protein